MTEEQILLAVGAALREKRIVVLGDSLRYISSNISQKNAKQFSINATKATR